MQHTLSVCGEIRNMHLLVSLQKKAIISSQAMTYPFPFVALTNSFFVYSCYHIRGPSDAPPMIGRLPAFCLKPGVLADCKHIVALGKFIVMLPALLLWLRYRVFVFAIYPKLFRVPAVGVKLYMSWQMVVVGP